MPQWRQARFRQLSVAILVLAVPVIAACSTHAVAEEKKSQRLAGKDIRLRVIGKVVTDDVHWSDYFGKDGILVSWSIGRKSTGKWEINGDELCITEGPGESPTCYQVWATGDEISLRLDGIETTFTGYLRKYEGQ